MHQVDRLHQKAMDLADQAAEARRQGYENEYLKLSASALKYEAEAAWKVAGETNLEPTRSVLFLSAATLALESREFRIAEQLVGAALAGTPPTDIVEELRDLLEDIYFHRHLEVRGITLSPDEVQMSIEGDAVGFGIARSEVFVQRVKSLETLIYRTAERRLGKEFREAGRRVKKLSEVFELYLSVPRAASFAVTLKLGQSPQMQLPGLDFTHETIIAVLDGLEVVNCGNIETLRQQIPDESYLVNFVGLAERLAPDGKDIRTVGFTTSTKQAHRVVALATPRGKIRERMHPQSRLTSEKHERHIEIQGLLLEADAKGKKEGMIEIVDNKGISHKIYVPRGMMSDIVKPMFEEEVRVSGRTRGTHIDLETIDLADPTNEVD